MGYFIKGTVYAAYREVEDKIEHSTIKFQEILIADEDVFGNIEDLTSCILDLVFKKERIFNPEFSIKFIKEESTLDLTMIQPL